MYYLAKELGLNGSVQNTTQMMLK
ncbi:MAG: hypothetical protein AB8V11_07675 [Francisella endosymbiont of Hyalomma asiaticum]